MVAIHTDSNIFPKYLGWVFVMQRKKKNPLLIFHLIQQKKSLSAITKERNDLVLQYSIKQKTDQDWLKWYIVCIISGWVIW